MTLGSSIEGSKILKGLGEALGGDSKLSRSLEKALSENNQPKTIQAAQPSDQNKPIKQNETVFNNANQRGVVV